MYDESYLNEVVETQGELFGKVDEHVPEIDIYDFIEKYMNSKTRAYIDQGQAYIATMSAGELWEYFQKEDSYIPKEGKAIGGFAADWTGRFYAYYQWYYKMTSRQVIEKIPVDFIVAGYRGLHDLELELAVQKVHEQIEKRR